MTPEEDPFQESRMTLGEHLEELRRRLIRSVVALTIVFIATWVFHDRIAQIVLWPLQRTVGWLNADLVVKFEEQLAEDPSLDRMLYFETADPSDPRLANPIQAMPRGDMAGAGFFFYMRICFYFSLFIAGPYILWEIWKFVAAGLYGGEKKVVGRYFPFSTLLFFGGTLFGYFMLVPYGQYYLVAFSVDQVRYDPEINTYFQFLRGLSLAMGAVFQLPVVMLALGRMGLVEPAMYSRYRGHFAVGALVLAAVLTPPDPITQLMMAGPMIVLYELGYWLARISAKPKARPDQADQQDQAGGL